MEKFKKSRRSSLFGIEIKNEDTPASRITQLVLEKQNEEIQKYQNLLQNVKKTVEQSIEENEKFDFTMEMLSDQQLGLLSSVTDLEYYEETAINFLNKCEIMKVENALFANNIGNVKFLC